MSFEYQRLIEERFQVTVDKVGGGTVGRSYDGEWLVSVLDTQAEYFPPLQEEIMRTGMSYRHDQVALMAFGFAIDEWDAQEYM